MDSEFQDRKESIVVTASGKRHLIPHSRFFFFFCDNHHLYSEHYLLFRNASLAETLSSPVSRPVKSPTQIVFNGSFGIRDFSCLNLGIRDFKEKSGRDSGLKLSREVACRKKRNIGITWLHEMWSRDYRREEPYWELPIQPTNVTFIHVSTLVKSRSPTILFQNLNIIQLLISCCFFFSLMSNRCNDAFL